MPEVAEHLDQLVTTPWLGIKAGITQVFGFTGSSIEPGGFHSGIDLGTPTGTPVYAPVGLHVRSAGWDDGYGNALHLQAPDGVEIVLGHLDRLLVQAGQDVEQGTLLALTGATGHVTGPHLHFEARQGGQAVDPIGWLQGIFGGVQGAVSGAGDLVHAPVAFWQNATKLTGNLLDARNWWRLALLGLAGGLIAYGLVIYLKGNQIRETTVRVVSDLREQGGKAAAAAAAA